MESYAKRQAKMNKSNQPSYNQLIDKVIKERQKVNGINGNKGNHFYWGTVQAHYFKESVNEFNDEMGVKVDIEMLREFAVRFENKFFMKGRNHVVEIDGISIEIISC